MKDKGVVVSTEKEFARVQVDCFSGCHDCTAHALCIGEKNKDGILSVRNPLGADRGDEVGLSIPEARYNRSLIVLFGSLLAATLAGGGAGYALGPHLSLAPSVGGAVGLAAALFLAGFWLARRFQKINSSALYPEIIEIIKKGAV